MGQPYNVWDIPSELGQEKIVIQQLSTLLKSMNIENHLAEDMRTAVSEACLNAIEHGNRLVTSCLVRVSMWVCSKSYVFRVYDDGIGFELQSAASPADEQRIQARIMSEMAREWGVLFMTRLADRFQIGWEQGRFYVEMHFFIMKEEG
jgi:serine/threonine-protein kinase RsbW